MRLNLTIGCEDQGKPPLSGLCIRQDDRFDSLTPDIQFLRQVNNVVIHIYLKDIWPEENRFNFSRVRDWMIWSQQMKTAHWLDIHFKLRIICGALSPLWMLRKCGSFPISAEGFETLPGAVSASNHCVKFWTDEYLTLWERLMAAIADDFDDDKYLNGIAMSATGVGTGEAMEWAISNQGEGEVRLEQYTTAGATSANTEAAIYRGIDAMKVFKRTNIEIVLTKFWHMEMPTSGTIEITKEIGEYTAQTFGERAELGNHGLRTEDGVDGDKWEVPNGHMWQLQQHYRAMRLRYGSGIYAQTASINNMGGEANLIPTLNRGLDYMVSLVELPEGETKIKEWFNNTQLEMYKNAYKANG